MMRRNFSILWSLILAIVFISGCSTNDLDPDSSSVTTANIQIYNENNLIKEENVEIDEQSVLLDVLQREFEVEVTEDGFITSIEGYDQNKEKSKYWLYTVNDEMPSVGVNDYIIQDQDQIVLELKVITE
ncbi:hypothetical protein DLJ74_09265 [Gracilibacillus dipsosauri]|uniref:Transcobalamin-like C-terminal domain-containing protein n=2 Tax=Bacillaceae TaxID=186817 RepID=A0A317KYJ5_9BACI|nr:hypothetical protein DLJ74_09265 [Gracilibacillus dipsosauri]